MEEQPRLITVEEKLENGGAGFQIEVECAVNEFELAAAAVEKALHGGEKSVERKLADRFVEGGETELAFVGTTSRGFDVNDAMREVVVGVEIVRQRERGEVGKRRAGRRSGRKSKGMSRSKRRRGRRGKELAAKLGESKVGFAGDDVVGEARDFLLVGFVTDFGAAENDDEVGTELFEKTDEDEGL